MRVTDAAVGWDELTEDAEKMRANDLRMFLTSSLTNAATMNATKIPPLKVQALLQTAT